MEKFLGKVRHITETFKGEYDDDEGSYLGSPSTHERERNLQSKRLVAPCGETVESGYGGHGGRPLDVIPPGEQQGFNSRRDFRAGAQYSARQEEHPIPEQNIDDYRGFAGHGGRSGESRDASALRHGECGGNVRDIYSPGPHIPYRTGYDRGQEYIGREEPAAGQFYEPTGPAKTTAYGAGMGGDVAEERRMAGGADRPYEGRESVAESPATYEGGAGEFGQQYHQQYHERRQSDYGDQQSGLYQGQYQPQPPTEPTYGGGFLSSQPYYDPSHALNFAAQHTHSMATNASPTQTTSYFTTALNHLREIEQDIASEPLDEASYINSHHQLYSSATKSAYGSGAQQSNASSIGAAAAMQALRAITSGGASGVGASPGAAPSGAGGSGGIPKDLNGFLGLAMAECVRLWDKEAGKGTVDMSLGGKQDAITRAAAMALKVYLQSQEHVAKLGLGGGAAEGTEGRANEHVHGVHGYDQGGKSDDLGNSMLLHLASQLMHRK